ncbi:hypothetical protein HOB10_01040 [Candidatus Parcubacteria bacterium]|jgi:hypothetical protein|nr:hypothetical protein [Candidatus Parcubacteria bacterium]
MSQRHEILGGYFPYCQFCLHDGSCALRHCDFLEKSNCHGIDNSIPYRGHEDFIWLFSIFQANSTRGSCSGRISQTNSPFYPLQCSCGTVINSLSLSSLMGGHACQKFTPNASGQLRLATAQEIAARRQANPEKDVLTEVELSELEQRCPFDQNYQSAMLL